MDVNEDGHLTSTSSEQGLLRIQIQIQKTLRNIKQK